ncbi:P1-P2 fusion protein [Pumpkin polerovirus]|uniref:P1-P2 fusion protein n=1 Tax=Pumpkin polerovirus TaxID=2518373 RepID=A0A3S7VIS1_9VIRU|nr:P1-P2 fusion protein [Pumpkin polerovirus]AYN77812.2 P1-P2 fusion protein [Pumpkin polerovirus]
MNMRFVVFFFFSLSLCAATWPEQGTELIPPQKADFNSSFDGLLNAEWSSDQPRVRWIERTFHWPPQEQEEITCDYSYHTIFQKLSENIQEDGKRLWSGATQQFKDFSISIYNLSRALASDACTLLIDWMIYLWRSMLWGVVWCVYQFVRTHFLRALTIAFLVACTACMAKCCKALFGLLAPFPLILLNTIKWICSIFYGMLTPFRNMRVRKINCWEKQLKGWNSFEIPMSPPSKSVIEITYDNGSHCGYAVTVQTYKKTASGAFESAVLTSLHCLEGSDDKFLFSRRTGSRISLAKCSTLAVWKSLDLCLLTPPENFQSTLGVKPCPMVCMDKLAGCEASFFRFNQEGVWSMTNSKLLGALKDGSVAVLVNSLPGHSGAPFFNGKHVLGVLRGPDPENNYNIMNPIPAIEGLTVPVLRFETTAPTGKLFNDANLSKALSEEYARLKDYKPASGKAWADYDSDEEYYEAAAKDFNGPSTVQGKRAGQARLPNQRGPSRLPENDAGNDGENDGQHFSGGHKRDCSGEACGKTIPHEQASPETYPPVSSAKQAEDFRHYFNSFYKWDVCAPSSEVPGFRNCGYLPQFYRPRKKGETEWGKTLTKEYPALGAATRGFGWPEFGPAAELKSLRLQSARWRERASSATIPCQSERERVIAELTERYSSVKSCAPACARQEELSWEGFLEDIKSAIPFLSLDAGVGVPYIAYGKTTLAQWVHDESLLPLVARLAFDRLKKMSEVSFEALSPEELVQAGLCDPIRVFVKGEPHKQSKLDEGRYRLIMSVSMVDQLVARVLFQNQNKTEIALWRAIPSKPGLGLSTDEQITDFARNLSQYVKESRGDIIERWHECVVPTDCSGFDWSVSSWMLEDDMVVRNNLTLNNTELTKRLRAAWLKCIANSVLCLSDGTLLAQEFPGVQKSGSYNTSSSNSRIRVMASIYAGASWCIAMGDDALESSDTDLRVYSDLGLKVEVSDKLEFCSHHFKSSSLAIPVNVGKMLYKLIHGYNIRPGCTPMEVIANYMSACYSVLNELRHVPEAIPLVSACLFSS